MFAIYNLQLLFAKYLTSVVAAVMQLISQIKFRICCVTKLERKSLESFFLCKGKLEIFFHK